MYKQFAMISVLLFTPALSACVDNANNVPLTPDQVAGPDEDKPHARDEVCQPRAGEVCK